MHLSSEHQQVADMARSFLAAACVLLLVGAVAAARYEEGRYEEDRHYERRCVC